VSRAKGRRIALSACSQGKYGLGQPVPFTLRQLIF
jgi:hypothetical protein